MTYLLTTFLFTNYRGTKKDWNNKFNNGGHFIPKKNVKNIAQDQQLIQWAGGLHQRDHFNKTKD